MARFSNLPNDDNTGRVLTYDFKKPAYASTLSVTTNASKTFIEPAVLTGAMTVNAVVTNAQEYDELVVILLSDTTSRTVTFGTNFKTTGTIAPAISKSATISFVFDGTNWLETGRAVMA